jgi:hypothetical protein
MARKKPNKVASKKFTWDQQEWFACRDPERILKGFDPLVDQTGIHISPRKWQLFMVACLYRIEQVFTDERSKAFIRTLEQYAEGAISEEELDRIGYQTIIESNTDNLRILPKEALSAEQLPISYAWDALIAAIGPTGKRDFPSEVWNMGFSAGTATGQPEAEWQVHAVLLHDVIGNPFHPSPPLPAAVLTWNDGTVRRIAEGIYEEKAFDRLPILADALLDAGCNDEQLIQHCRSPGPHIRGCWALDLILGKN